MAASFKVFAHCADNELVRVTVVDGGRTETLHLKNGQEIERHIYDDRDHGITVRKVVACAAQQWLQPTANP